MTNQACEGPRQNKANFRAGQVGWDGIGWDGMGWDGDKGFVQTNPIPLRRAGTWTLAPMLRETARWRAQRMCQTNPIRTGRGPEDGDKGVVQTNPIPAPVGWDMGARAHATGHDSVAGTANVRNEPNSDGPGAEREVSVNEQSQFGGAGTWAGRPCYGDDPGGEIPQHSTIPLFQHSSIPAFPSAAGGTNKTPASKVWVSRKVL